MNQYVPFYFATRNANKFAQSYALHANNDTLPHRVAQITPLVTFGVASIVVIVLFSEEQFKWVFVALVAAVMITGSIASIIISNRPTAKNNARFVTMKNQLRADGELSKAPEGFASIIGATLEELGFPSEQVDVENTFRFFYAEPTEPRTLLLRGIEACQTNDQDGIREFTQGLRSLIHSTIR